MTDNETQIRELVARWTRAVHSGDLAGVLADHADDIVMYDVPPPYQGVRGIDAYRESWPPFFQWQASGATFELASLDVTVSDTVAFAYALLRCGTSEQLTTRPDYLLRLTLGLRKEHGRWLVAHEHHSFPDDDTDRREESEREVRALHQSWFEATEAKDLDGLMRPIAETVVSYEHGQPLAYAGRDEVRAVCAEGLERSEGTVTWTVPDLTVLVRDDLAVAWGLNRMTAQVDNAVVESWSRGTRIFQKTERGWEVVHQHGSFPFDPATGQARTDLTPRGGEGSGPS